MPGTDNNTNHPLQSRVAFGSPQAVNFNSSSPSSSRLTPMPSQFVKSRFIIPEESFESEGSSSNGSSVGRSLEESLADADADADASGSGNGEFTIDLDNTPSNLSHGSGGSKKEKRGSFAFGPSPVKAMNDSDDDIDQDDEDNTCELEGDLNALLGSISGGYGTDALSIEEERREYELEENGEDEDYELNSKFEKADTSSSGSRHSFMDYEEGEEEDRTVELEGDLQAMMEMVADEHNLSIHDNNNTSNNNGISRNINLSDSSSDDISTSLTLPQILTFSSIRVITDLPSLLLSTSNSSKKNEVIQASLLELTSKATEIINSGADGLMLMRESNPTLYEHFTNEINSNFKQNNGNLKEELSVLSEAIYRKVISEFNAWERSIACVLNGELIDVNSTVESKIKDVEDMIMLTEGQIREIDGVSRMKVSRKQEMVYDEIESEKEEVEKKMREINESIQANEAVNAKLEQSLQQSKQQLANYTLTRALQTELNSATLLNTTSSRDLKTLEGLLFYKPFQLNDDEIVLDFTGCAIDELHCRLVFDLSLDNIKVTLCLFNSRSSYSSNNMVRKTALSGDAKRFVNYRMNALIDKVNNTLIIEDGDDISRTVQGVEQTLGRIEALACELSSFHFKYDCTLTLPLSKDDRTTTTSPVTFKMNFTSLQRKCKITLTLDLTPNFPFFTTFCDNVVEVKTAIGEFDTEGLRSKIEGVKGGWGGLERVVELIEGEMV